MWRNLLVITALAIILSIFSFIAIAMPVFAPLAGNIYYTFGFPYFLSAFLAISLVTFSAGLASYLKLAIGAPGAPLSFPLRLFFALVDPSPLSPFTWIILGFISLSFVFLSLVGLLPRCLPSSEMETFLAISKDEVAIGNLYPLETLSVEPGTTLRIKSMFETPNNKFPLPMTCNWSALGDGQPQPRDTINCSIMYDAGVDESIDVLTLKPKQAHCSSLGSYHFYFKSTQREMEENNE